MKVLQVFTLPMTAEAFFDGQFRYLGEHGVEITIASNALPDMDFCTWNNVTAKVFPIARSINPIADIRAIWALTSDIKKNSYDIVVGHTPKGAMVAMFAAALAGVKTRIYYRHGLIYTTARGVKRRLLKTIEQLTAGVANHIVNVSPSLSKLAVKDHLNSATKQTVIGAGTCGGIDTVNLFNPQLINESEREALRKSLGLSASDFIVGFCGRLCKDKGIRELIDGFKIFARSKPSAKLLLIGDFDARDILPPAYREEISYNSSIITTGFISKEKLPLYYSLMDVFVFPSYREGFGMCVIEASAMERPVLVSRSHGCVDSIREHVTGEYIDISADSISERLSFFLDKNKRTEYGLNGRRWVQENFEQRILWPQIGSFYSALTL